MSGSPYKQYGLIAVSISDCQVIFDLNRYTPEQIVDAVFSVEKTKPMSKETFSRAFKATFEKNVTPDNLPKVNDAISRIFDICVQGQTVLTVDQLGKGVGVFTTRRENSSLFRDLFFYLDRDFRSVINQTNVQNFLQEAATRGITRNISREIAEFYDIINKEKNNTELTYWGFYIWRNHPALVALQNIYKEFQDKRSTSQTPSYSNVSYGSSTIQTSNIVNIPPTQIPKNVEVSSEKPYVPGAYAGVPSQQVAANTQVNVPAQSNVPQYNPNVQNVNVRSTGNQDAPSQSRFGQAAADTTKSKFSTQSPKVGEDSPLMSRKTGKLKSFEEFLDLGAKLGMTQMSAKDFIRGSREYFASHKQTHHDMMLHEFIRMCVEMFKPEDYDYYDYVDNIVKIFQFMDLNDNGILELNEALQGIIHLFSDTEEDKLIAAFMLFDQDNSGFIDFNEIYDFIFSTIRLMKHTGSSAISEQQEQEIKDIAYATALDVFNMMDVDHNGQITLEEFLVWYRSTHGEFKPAEIEAAKAIKEHKMQEFQKKVEEHKEKADPKAKAKQQLPDDKVKQELENSKADTFLVEDIRSKIPLDKIHIQIAMEFLKNEITHENVNFMQFEGFLFKLIENQGLPGKEHVRHIAKNLFNALDSNKNSLLELSEIATGLGLLCGGNMVEKMKAGFDLFDENHDRVLSFHELEKFFGAFFKIIRCDNPNLDVYNSNPDEFAHAMAISVFHECHIPHHGAIDFATFKTWVSHIQV